MAKVLNAMECPDCDAADVPPLSGSTWVLAWYDCPNCGAFWTARVRDGRPMQEGVVTHERLQPHRRLS